MSRERSADTVRFLRLLESAHPADVPAVVSVVPEAELAAAIDAVAGRVSLPVREYILTQGSTSVLIALARHAVLGQDEGAANTVDRILMRCDPRVDEFFFGLDPAVGLVRRARRVILRDRKGPRGHAVITPRIKRVMLDGAADAAPGSRLMKELAIADDPDLVLTLMPFAGLLSAKQAASVITTLVAHGRRREAKHYRGLWADRGSDFSVLGFRRVAALSEKYGLGSGPGAEFSPEPDDSVEGVFVEEYRRHIDWFHRYPSDAGIARLRRLAWTALRAGTMSATEVLRNTYPAQLVLWMAVCGDLDDLRPGERRAADDVRLLLSQYAANRLGTSPESWTRAITRVKTYPGTILELFGDGDPSQDPDTLSFSNILLALAPRAVAADVLAARDVEPLVATAASNFPLCRALVEHIVRHGTFEQCRRLAANEATPDSVLARLMDAADVAGSADAADASDIMFPIIDRHAVSPEILERAYRAAPRDVRMRDWIVDRRPADALDVLRCAADDPAWVLSVMRAGVPKWGEPGRRAAYAMLAEIAGVEAVWALELELTGALAAMAGYVRESMAGGGMEPLIEAAQAWPAGIGPRLRDLRAEALFAPWRTDEALDRPLNRPLENLIRAHLDGRPKRWAEIADLLRLRPEASDEAILAEFAVLIEDPTLTRRYRRRPN